MSISKISKGTIIRTIMMLIAVVNTICSSAGLTTLDIDENTLYTVLTGAWDVVTLVLVWWKDNSFTKRAKTLESIKKAIKEDGLEMVLGMFNGSEVKKNA